MRKYFLVVNCKINEALEALSIKQDDLSIMNFKEEVLLNSDSVDDQIKRLYSGCPAPGISKIFRTGSDKWSTILKLEV